MKMNLYVWYGVLSDYTDGLAYAVAPTLEKAIDAVVESDKQFEASIRRQLTAVAPTITPIKAKMAVGAAVWGGG